MFIDLRKALDKIYHGILSQKLSHLGISAKKLNIIKSLFDNATIKLLPNGQTQPWEVNATTGILQGESLSSFSFNAFVADFLWSTGHFGVKI